jgi:large subunit ribosomal protein L24
MTLSSQGRSASALSGATSGSGTVTLEAARIAGLDPRAFDLAIRASDAGQPTDDVRLRKIVEPALSGGALLVSSAQIPFTLRDGRLRVSATALEADGVRAMVSGGYDIPADQADVRATLAAPGASAGQPGAPEIQIFAAGPPDALNKTVDVAALSSWLAVRTIDRETKRLDSIERGEATPTSLLPPQQTPPLQTPSQPPQSQVSRPQVQQPQVQVPQSSSTPSEAISSPPAADTPRPSAPRPRVSAPRPPAAPPVANAPTASQQAQQLPPPLPPPIEVRPAPSVARPVRPRPPLILTPPAATVQPSF